MIASNEASIVPADMGDRRWQIFEVGERNRENREYFANIADQLENGGYAAMLHDLLNRDISKGPNPRKIIRTVGLFEQIMRAAGPEIRYIHQLLDNGFLPQLEAPGNTLQCDHDQGHVRGDESACWRPICGPESHSAGPSVELFRASGRQCTASYIKRWNGSSPELRTIHPLRLFRLSWTVERRFFERISTAGTMVK